jgi:hypothetical protein
LEAVKLPGAEHAVIPRSKIADYLLSETHFDGRHKAAFFRSFGYAAARWQELAAALRRHAIQNAVAREEPSPFGRRYIVEGIIETPDGRTPQVRSIWFIRTGENIVRFVTAYPLKSGRSEND